MQIGDSELSFLITSNSQLPQCHFQQLAIVTARRMAILNFSRDRNRSNRLSNIWIVHISLHKLSILIEPILYKKYVNQG